MARVRTYASQMDMNTAVNRAVEECISEGILADFLFKLRAEVVAMSIFEYDEERERELIKKAEFECGKEEGLKLGKAQGIELGKAQGVAQGIIETCREVGLSREDTIEKICKKLSLTEEEARKQIDLFWLESEE